MKPRAFLPLIFGDHCSDERKETQRGRPKLRARVPSLVPSDCSSEAPVALPDIPACTAAPRARTSVAGVAWRDESLCLSASVQAFGYFDSYIIDNK